MWTRFFPVVAVAALTACALVRQSAEPPPTPPPLTSWAPELLGATVTRIVDGDTARMQVRGNEERVRFIGMDTPERGRPYFEEASAFAAQHLEGRQVSLELDIDERDRYGRLLAYVWTEPPRSRSEAEIRDRMFNARSLLEGYAAVLTVPPNVRYADRFLEYQREAREAGRGLWADP